MTEQSVSLPENWRGLEKINSRGFIAEGEVTVFIASNEVELDHFVGNVHDGIATLCQAHGAVVPVSEQEIGAYFRTALDARISRVRNERSTSGARVEDTWALPDPFQYVLSAVGRVELQSPQVVILPQMAKGVEVLDLNARNSITRKLRALGPIGLRLHRAIEAKREGVARVMRLVITDIGDDVILMDTDIFTVLDALTARSLGMRHGFSEGKRPNEIIPSNPLWAPGFQMYGKELITFEFKFADIGFTKAPA